uniref:DNA mismatch repair protein n=1 Tax=Ascaris lumbricoides TaxID=6252 RepID=A0A0M3HPP5_ASCLU
MTSNRKQTSLLSFFAKADGAEDGSPSRFAPSPVVRCLFIFSAAVEALERAIRFRVFKLQMKQKENIAVEKVNRSEPRKSSQNLKRDKEMDIGTPKRGINDDALCSPLKRHETPKRRRIVLSSDSESDNETAKEDKAKEYGKECTSTPINSPLISEAFTPNAAKKFESRTSTPRSLPRTSAARGRSIVSEMAHSFIGSFRASEENMASDISSTSTGTLDASMYKMNERGGTSKSEKVAVIDECDEGHFPHLDFDFLQPDKIRDANGRLASDLDYCPRTLFVPEAFLKQQTPGHRQWWLAKSAYFDTMLLFKVGKFYEMYHMDAVIGVENLNLTYMRGKIAHCGFPEVAYGRFADQLVNRGYKVARVEQTETPAQLEERNKLEKNREKVVRREICRVTSAGTRTYGVLDTCDGESALDAVEPTARHLFAFAEKVMPNGLPTYGVCFIDTSVGRFYVAQFTDDANRSSMRTLFAHYQPSQILYERGRISPASQSLLNSSASAVIKEALIPKKEFPDAEGTIKMLTNKLYFGEVVQSWPDTLRNLLADADALNPKCASEFNECMAALGAVLWYLKRSLIDVDMVTMRNFERYIPPSLSGNRMSQRDSVVSDETYWRGRRMVLDGISLYNLNIVPPLDGVKRSALRDSTSSKYSLYNTINKCITPFGKRMLRQWVCAPSCDADVLRSRQDAIQWLMNSSSKIFADKATELLRKMPDLERLVQKIHTLGLKYRASEHPDGRAVMFEPLRYNRRKIGDLLSALSGFERVDELAQFYREMFVGDEECCLPEFHPELIAYQLLLFSPQLMDRCFGASFPDISNDLHHFKDAFDHDKAKQEGIIVPEKGIDAEYDGVMEDIRERMRDLEAYLHKIRKQLGCEACRKSFRHLFTEKATHEDGHSRRLRRAGGTLAVVVVRPAPPVAFLLVDIQPLCGRISFMWGSALDNKRLAKIKLTVQLRFRVVRERKHRNQVGIQLRKFDLDIARDCIHLFSLQRIQYMGSGRSRYQLEIPEAIAQNLSADFELKSSRKGYRRMTTDESVRLFEELLEAETRRDVIRRDVMRRVFADFDTRAAKWAAVTERVAVFDVLLSLARYANSSGLGMCRPEFVYDSEKPLLDIVAGYHPCLAAKISAAKEGGANTNYIPNDTQLGGNHPLTMLLTGPNMGGKSTLMRQVAVLVVLAQIGSLVPAAKMRLSPVDRIFTRIGANDRIAAGQSTFFVELSEANIILRDASVHSLVVMDELGRGTSTHDGTAIAYAVLRALAEKVRCRAFFSTHYHSLCNAVRDVPNIKAAHMACIVDNENYSDPTLEHVTFLYSLTSGVCPKSYGFFAAKVSGIKPEVIRAAFAASQRLSTGACGKWSRLQTLVQEAKSGCDAARLSQMLASM